MPDIHWQPSNTRQTGGDCAYDTVRCPSMAEAEERLQGAQTERMPLDTLPDLVPACLEAGALSLPILKS